MELKLTTKDGRTFHLDAVLPYTRKDGGASSIAVWSGACRQCGALYEVTTPGSLAAIQSSSCFGTVHCDAHKQRRKPKATPQQSEGGADSPAPEKEKSE
jgi:hypothetical protein